MKKALLVLLLLSCSIGGLAAYHYAKTKRIDQRFSAYLQNRFAEQFGMKIVVEKISGNPAGQISISGIRLSVPKGEKDFPIFSAKEVRFKYSILDLFREDFSSWFDIVLIEPVFYTNMPFQPQVKEARSLEAFSGIVHRVKRNARLIIRKGTIVWIGQEGVVSEIDGMVQDKSFKFRLSLNHIQIHGFDITTTVTASGDVVVVDDEGRAKLVSNLKTDGTVVNWKPMPNESEMSLEITYEALEILSGNILGGIKIHGSIGHGQDRTLDVEVTADDYPLEQIFEIMSFSGADPIGTTMSSKLNFTGSVFEPKIHGSMIIQNPDGKDGRFRNMQLNFEGVYPEVELSESRMVSGNGTIMNFSNQQLNVSELFLVETYERLIRQNEQTTVAWGDWTLARREDKDSVSLEKALADDMSLRYQRSEHDETRLQTDENENEFSLEYYLNDLGSFAMDIRDDEQLFTLKNKTEF